MFEKARYRERLHRATLPLKSCNHSHQQLGFPDRASCVLGETVVTAPNGAAVRFALFYVQEGQE